jgi:hypothetical protein
LRRFYLPVEGRKFGSESRDLYERYLSRRPGDSLAPVVFNSPSSEVVTSFAESGATEDDQDEIIDLIGARLNRAPGPLRDHSPTMMSVANFLSRTELDNRPINYGNPFSIAATSQAGSGAATPDLTTGRSNGQRDLTGSRSSAPRGMCSWKRRFTTRSSTRSTFARATAGHRQSS